MSPPLGIEDAQVLAERDVIPGLEVESRVLADLTLDVHLAKVATYTDRVIDAFYVRDALGRKVTDRAQVAEIESTVRARLDR